MGVLLLTQVLTEKSLRQQMSVGRLLVYYWPAVGRLLAGYWQKAPCNVVALPVFFTNYSPFFTIYHHKTPPNSKKLAIHC
jgi:hypothetical protein